MAATSVAASELDCSDSSSMVPSVSEGLYWDNESSAGSQYHPYIKLASNMRDSLMKHGTWEYVYPPSSANLTGLRFVFRTKRCDDLVARAVSVCWKLCQNLCGLQPYQDLSCKT